MSATIDHFEALYRADADPWQVASAWYERRKRALLLASLPDERYTLGIELGCGNGEATRLLAQRCDQLHAVDGAPAALTSCRQRLQQDRIDNVTLYDMLLPVQWPTVEGADLIVVSELAYYFDDDDLARFGARIASSLRPGGHLAMCHWRLPFDDRRQETVHAHASVAAAASLHLCIQHREDAFQLDVWTRSLDTLT